MSFARQAPFKKFTVKKLSDLCNHLWTDIQGLAEVCERIGIVFD